MRSPRTSTTPSATGGPPLPSMTSPWTIAVIPCAQSAEGIDAANRSSRNASVIMISAVAGGSVEWRLVRMGHHNVEPIGRGDKDELAYLEVFYYRSLAAAVALFTPAFPRHTLASSSAPPAPRNRGPRSPARSAPRLTRESVRCRTRHRTRRHGDGLPGARPPQSASGSDQGAEPGARPGARGRPVPQRDPRHGKPAASEPASALR